MLPLPPEGLRVWAGPFSDADLFDLRSQTSGEGIACEETWLLQAIERAGFRIAAIQRGSWRTSALMRLGKTTSLPRSAKGYLPPRRHIARVRQVTRAGRKAGLHR